MSLMSTCDLITRDSHLFEDTGRIAIVHALQLNYGGTQGTRIDQIKYNVRVGWLSS